MYIPNAYNTSGFHICFTLAKCAYIFLGEMI